MQEVIDKLKELIEMLEKKPEYRKYKDYWLTHVPEKHRKFAAYWNELGRPELEATCKNMTGWISIIPDWSENLEYRIKEAKPWYEQEISNDKPMLLRYIPHNSISSWKEAPRFFIENYEPLTDQEIDALKRGF